MPSLLLEGLQGWDSISGERSAAAAGSWRIKQFLAETSFSRIKALTNWASDLAKCVLRVVSFPRNIYSVIKAEFHCLLKRFSVGSTQSAFEGQLSLKISLEDGR